MKLENKKVLITGGSSGIGRAILHELIQHGVQQIAVMGRKAAALEQLKEDFPGTAFLLIQGDVSKAEDLERLISEVTETWGGLDLLINNAGVVSAGLLSEMREEDIISQISINVTGLILLTQKALPLLKNSCEGAIINVSSGYGYIAMPFYSVYAATKAAVRQFSDALRRELDQHAIHVMTVYPSATDTPMMETAVVENMDTSEEVARLTIEGLVAGEINVILGGEERKKQIRLNFDDPLKMDEIARASYPALERRTEKHRSM